MTMSPPPDSAVPDAGGELPFVPPSRPGSVTFIGIVGIILAVGGVLCIGGGMAFSFVRDDPNMRNAPQAMMMYNIGLTMMSVLLSFFLLVGVIGLLAHRSWSRKTMIVYAWVDLLYGIGKLVLSLIVLLPMMMEMFAHNPPEGIKPQMLPMIRYASIAQSILLCLVTSAYDIAVLIVVNRRNVREALNDIPPAKTDGMTA